MTRRSTRLMRMENSLYAYNSETESWNIKDVGDISTSDNVDLFEQGSYFTCKHMSQKVSPISFRLDNIGTWESSWYSKYKECETKLTKVQIDFVLREYLKSVLNSLNILVSSIYIKEKNSQYFVSISLHELGTSSNKETYVDLRRKKRFIMQGYSEIEETGKNPFYISANTSDRNTYVDIPKLLSHIEQQMCNYIKAPVHITALPIKDIGESASLLCSFLKRELEKPNPSFKRALKECLSRIALKAKIRGLRVNCSGRLGRAPMAKLEWFKYGSIPLTKISSKIDYHHTTGKTKYGSFGVKVWLYKY